MMEEKQQYSREDSKPGQSSTFLPSDSGHRDEVRFWQSIALALMIFSLGLVGSFVISLIVMLLSK
jgi:hypothetical protein